MKKMPTYLNVPTKKQNLPQSRPSLADGYFMTNRLEDHIDTHDHHITSCTECLEAVKQVCSKQPILSPEVVTAIRSVDTIPNTTIALFWLNVAVIIISIIIKFR